jgi:regulator of protease activity HflC (stomatin/prohibitin superfamily)
MTAVLVAIIIIVAVVAAVAGSSIRILREYERAVVFRLGRLLGQKGPGIVLLIPGIDRMVRVDLRTVTFDVPPQDLITRDNVPAKVNAVTYFRVVDPVKSVIEVERYRAATSQIAQTTLRSVLGKADLDMLLSERERLNEALQQIIDEQTDPWGIKVTTVEIKDVGIPQGMQRAMARQAEAERERRAKVINAEGEFQASERLYDAAQIMSANPTALQLRYLQTLLELGSSQASTIVFPLPIDMLKPLLQATQLDGTEHRPAPVREGDESERSLKAAGGARELGGGESGEPGEAAETAAGGEPSERQKLGAEVEADVEAQVERVKADVERVQADLAARRKP